MERKNDRLPIFTERFRELQGEKTNTEFADFLGISRQTVGFYCNGDRVPDALTLIKISQKCGVSADWLLGLSDYKNKETESTSAKELGLSEKSVNFLARHILKPDFISTINLLIEDAANMYADPDGSESVLENIVRLFEVVPFELSSRWFVATDGKLYTAEQASSLQEEYNNLVDKIFISDIIEVILLDKIKRGLQLLKIDSDYPD
jgi:transcriptional regulator with XRE-family HTH domain